MGSLTIEPGVLPEHRGQAAVLFWEAFSGKIGALLGPRSKALPFLARVLDSNHAISARDGSGALVGVAGFKTAQGAFVGGDWSDLAHFYGSFGAAWRAVPLAMLERPVEPGVLLMDGICVDGAARGQGIGTGLLAAIKAEANRRNLGAVRLDVIDSNPRAKALYEREGFVPAGVVNLGPLRHLFVFRTATTMTCLIP